MRRRAEEEMTMLIADSHTVAMDKAQTAVKGFWKSLVWPIVKKILAAFIAEFAAELLNNIKRSETIDLVEKY